MNIEKTFADGIMTIKLCGRLDTAASPELEREMGDLMNAEKLVLDFENVDYVSSAGLRLLIKAHKMMNGALVVRRPNEMVNEVLEITRLIDVLNIEN